MKVVFNTSPIIFLYKLGYLELALNLFDDIYIPASVFTEISRKEDKLNTLIEVLIQEEAFKQREIKLINIFRGLNQRIGRGESEAIVLAIELEADYVILDDFVARKEAIKLGLNVKGTLGIIRKLMIDKYIEVIAIDDLYEKLKEMKFRVKKDVFNKIFE
ncbi:MAG: DUF3368 domain-containing protein [Planctomycetes bacterium]|nr:DUF3368 domain-containing protein [Planctomycetota bacterium]